MRRIIATIMIANAALFLFGSVQHAGIAIGPFEEPQIVPASIVEALCAVVLISGAVAVFRGGRWGRVGALIGNAIAAAGVALGMAALAAGRGPRTASNDLYHRVMLILAAAAVILLFMRSARTAPGRP